MSATIVSAGTSCPRQHRDVDSSAAQAGGGMLPKKGGKHGDDDRRPERRVGPVVHRPGAKLWCAEEARAVRGGGSTSWSRGEPSMAMDGSEGLARDPLAQQRSPPPRSAVLPSADVLLTRAASEVWMLEGPPRRWRVRVSADRSSRPSCSTTARSAPRCAQRQALPDGLEHDLLFVQQAARAWRAGGRVRLRPLRAAHVVPFRAPVAARRRAGCPPSPRSPHRGRVRA